MRKVFILHPYLFAIFPVLFLFAHNIQELGPKDIILPAIIILGATTLILLLANLFLKDRNKNGIITSIFLILFFSYGQVYSIIVDHKIIGFVFGRHRYLLIVWAIVFFFCLGRVIKTKKSLGKVASFLTISSICLIAISIFNIRSYYLHTPIRITEKNSPDISRTENASPYPHIYYIILDSYARADVLKELYGYDNLGFVKYLENKGFYVADKSTTNYVDTHYSLTSSLNFEYIEKLNPRERLYRLKNNSVNEFLKKRGYKSIVFDDHFFEVRVHKGERFSGEKFILPYFQRLLIGLTPLSIPFSETRVNNFRNNLLIAFDRLPDLAKSKEPVFVFAHIEAPHPPFVFGPDGEEIYAYQHGMSNKKGLTSEQYRKYYSGEVAFINKKLEKAINGIFLKSKRPFIIVLQGDHGPCPPQPENGYNKLGMEGSCSILNAYYFPDRDYLRLSPDITPVNTFRLIFNQYFGANYDFLETKIFIQDKKTVTDVTDRVQITGHGHR